MFSRKTVTALALTAAIAVAFSARAQETEMSADTVIATVNGTEITLANVIAARMVLPEQYQTMPDAQLYDGLVNQLVQQELLKQTISEPDESLLTQLQNQERVLMAGAALERIADEAISETDLQSAYDARFAEFEPGREYHAAHILLESEEDAIAVIEELKGGADFATLAREKSTGPSGPNGGDLGWFGAGMMVAPFEEAVVAMEPNTFSQTPVQTQFGFHVIQLSETRLAEAPTLDEMRDELASDLQEAAISKAIEDLVANADVSLSEGIDPAALRMDQLLKN
ncbi:peptidylprolyl isomerase [Celeribacter arenosi]|uniref:Parvulin-like PPIase n=1 Tax=Celeribacter arenosi TaxID=792649 RepID=A0ABP7JYN4_9RHOB